MGLNCSVTWSAHFGKLVNVIFADSLKGYIQNKFISLGHMDIKHGATLIVETHLESGVVIAHSSIGKFAKSCLQMGLRAEKRASL